MRHSHRAKLFEQLYEHIVALLNKEEDSPEFRNLLNIVGKPSSKYDVGPHRFYGFHKFGFDMTYETSLRVFYTCTFEFDTAGTRSREVQQYRGSLPMGIRWTDSCAEVERKFGVKPESPGGWVPGCQSASCDAKSRASSFWQHYECPPYRYTLIFEREEGGLGLLGMRLLGRDVAANET